MGYSCIGGASGPDTGEILKQLGSPQVFCRTAGRRPAWGVHRPCGLFIVAYFGANDQVEAMEFGRPDRSDDAVPHDGLDVFTMQQKISSPGCDSTRASTRKKPGAVTAPSLFLSLWRPVTPQPPDDHEGRFFESVLIARPGYLRPASPPGDTSRE